MRLRASPHGEDRQQDRHPQGQAVAIVHDWFQGFHGSERVVDTIFSDIFSRKADILTFHAAHGLLPAHLSEAIVRESALARLPGIRQRGHDPGHWRLLLPYMPHYFGGLDLSRYEVVISSSHACAAHVRPPADALHVCYCHTPMRYAWLPQTDGHRVKGAKAALLRRLGGRLRRLDRDASRRPDSYVANSSAVRERIQRYYGRDAVVIHPPVDVADQRAETRREVGHFLWVHRLVPYKQPEVVVEAFRNSPHRLTMVGVGPLESRLRATLPSNVDLRGWVERSELDHLYQSTSGFIHVGQEDFGMTMVEALAAGTPIIAFNGGGARDIVRPDQDGLLLDSVHPGSVRHAVDALVSRSWDRAALHERARAFSRERFVARFSEHLAALLEARIRQDVGGPRTADHRSLLRHTVRSLDRPQAGNERVARNLPCQMALVELLASPG